MKKYLDTRKFSIRYGFAIVVSFGALAMTRWTIPMIKSDAFDFFQGAVVLSAWYGGLGPGLVAAGGSILALDYYFIPPLNEFSYGKTDLLRLAIFGAVAVLTSSLSARLKKAKSDLEKVHGELEIRIEDRTRELSQAYDNLKSEIQQRTEAERAIMEVSSREQRRLGQDLHDGLSQILAGLKFMTERVKRELIERSIPESSKLAVIEAQLSEALGIVDTVSRGLYPVELETNGLMSALVELVNRISQVFPVKIQFKCPTPVALRESGIANHVYRIAQESVMNAIKGGKASRINIRLAHRGDRLMVSVADNGIGFGNQPMRKGMGLKLMEYRARVIKGSLVFKSRPRGGTLVRCFFPIQSELDT